MSEMEHVRGTLTKYNGPIEDFYELHVGHPPVNDEQIEDYLIENYRFVHVYNGQVYYVDAEDCDHDSDIADAWEVDYDTVAFELRWYNGGASMSEVLDDALDNIKVN